MEAYARMGMPAEHFVAEGPAGGTSRVIIISVITDVDRPALRTDASGPLGR